MPRQFYSIQPNRNASKSMREKQHKVTRVKSYSLQNPWFGPWCEAALLRAITRKSPLLVYLLCAWALKIIIIIIIIIIIVAIIMIIIITYFNIQSDTPQNQSINQNLYSAPLRYLLRGAPDPGQAEKSSL